MNVSLTYKNRWSMVTAGRVAGWSRHCKLHDLGADSRVGMSSVDLARANEPLGKSPRPSNDRLPKVGTLGVHVDCERVGGCSNLHMLLVAWNAGQPCCQRHHGDLGNKTSAALDRSKNGGIPGSVCRGGEKACFVTTVTSILLSLIRRQPPRTGPRAAAKIARELHCARSSRQNHGFEYWIWAYDFQVVQ